MKVLVTGAGGMVGSHLVEFLSLRGDEVYGIWHKNRKNVDEVTLPVHFIQSDLRYAGTIDEIIADFLPDEIYHLASQSYPTLSWQSPVETLDVNITSTVNVFEAVKKARKYISHSYDPIVVVACSSAEYGETLNIASEKGIEAVREDALLLPLHPYGVSKVGQDLLSFQYFMNDRIRCIRARIFNSTGTRKTGDVTSDFTRRAVEAERSGVWELRVGNLSSRRAIMDQRDLVNALTLLASKGREGEAYNISSEHVYRMADIVKIIEKETGHTFDIKVDEKLLRPTDERIIVGDITKLCRDTLWKEQITMEETVRDMLSYWRSVL